MGAHTPGPWVVGIEVEATGEIEVVSDGRPYICMVLPGAIDDRTRANARLIAAAPELLALSVKGEALISGDLIGAEWKRACDEFVKEARATITQATGAKP